MLYWKFHCSWSIYVGIWIATCDCDECLEGSYSLVAVATNENGQSGSATVEFSIQSQSSGWPLFWAQQSKHPGPVHEPLIES